MNTELQNLFVKLLSQALERFDQYEARIKALETRLAEVEKLAHKQITEEDLIKRYKDFVLPTMPEPPKLPQWPWPPAIPVWPDPNIVPAPWKEAFPDRRPHNPRKPTTLC